MCVVGKGGYNQTRTWTRTFSKHTFTFMQQLFFIPNVVFTAVFVSRPGHRSCHSTYPFIIARAKD